MFAGLHPMLEAKTYASNRASLAVIVARASGRVGDWNHKFDWVFAPEMPFLQENNGLKPTTNRLATSDQLVAN
jgi:hypothetical protein